MNKRLFPSCGSWILKQFLEVVVMVMEVGILCIFICKHWGKVIPAQENAHFFPGTDFECQKTPLISKYWACGLSSTAGVIWKTRVETNSVCVYACTHMCKGRGGLREKHQPSNHSVSLGAMPGLPGRWLGPQFQAAEQDAWPGLLPPPAPRGWVSVPQQPGFLDLLTILFPSSLFYQNWCSVFFFFSPPSNCSSLRRDLGLLSVCVCYFIFKSWGFYLYSSAQVSKRWRYFLPIGGNPAAVSVCSVIRLLWWAPLLPSSTATGLLFTAPTPAAATRKMCDARAGSWATARGRGVLESLSC